ncbi:MAG: CBS domain-containing protein [Candidatus Thiothrix singaporensis]|uniref:CBS domain-containing protein n=1 Tax=Candidatus Thiothrix singaporensis TaxID=2799669 RepID=A0A7L6AQA2_9GAMM|nr:MAG: CBS domain-containing protein [Candidatus Thiothrix singaporensis]
MKVKEIMTTNVKTAKADTPVRDIVEVMCFNKISGLPVVDDSNNVVGVVSEKTYYVKCFLTFLRLRVRRGGLISKNGKRLQ